MDDLNSGVDSAASEDVEQTTARFSRNNGLGEETSHAWLEYQVPLILFSIGFVALLGSAIALTGWSGVVWAVFFILAVLFVQVPITIVGMYILGAVLGIGYGLLKSAVLKLAAIEMVVASILVTGVVVGYPAVALLILSPLASWALFSVLFDLDARDTIASGIGLWVLGVALNAILRIILSAGA
jgi:hypothetical protein